MGSEKATSKKSESESRRHRRERSAQSFGHAQDLPFRRLQRNLGNNGVLGLLSSNFLASTDGASNGVQTIAHYPGLQANPTTVPAVVDQVLRSPGVPLDRELRREMEGRFQQDFSSVRLHSDQRAASSAKSVAALAYTVGEHVAFGNGQYAPHRQSGRTLLAHELAHVVQQRRGGGSPSGPASPGLESDATRAGNAAVLGHGPVVVTGNSSRGLARQAEPLTLNVFQDEAGVSINSVPVLKIDAPKYPGGFLPVKIDFEAPKRVILTIARDPRIKVQADLDALLQLSRGGLEIVIKDLRPAPDLSERPIHIAPSFPPPLRRPQTPPPAKPRTKPAKPPASKPPDTAPKLDLSGGESEQKPPPLPMATTTTAQTASFNPEQAKPQAADVNASTKVEGDLGAPVSSNAGGFSSADSPGPSSDPETQAMLEKVIAELSEVEPLVAKLEDGVANNPKDQALNLVRGVAARLQTDQQVLEEFEKRKGPLSADAKAAIDRIKQLRQIMADAVVKAEKWHTDNPAGDSLGMSNEKAGVWLAGQYDKEWDKGGIHYVSGGAAIAGAFVVAFVDAGEKLISFGFHDAATAVSEAYARGDISWNEGEDILEKAAWRAILIAAVTRGAGAATSRLGTFAAEGAGLVPRTVPFGLVSGGVSAGLSGAAGLATQSFLTKAHEEDFTSPAAKAIWAQGMPQGKDWAISIPIAVFLGALGGANAVRVSNQQLVGTVLNTSEGQLEVIAVTKEGQVVAKPVGGTANVPPPPPSDITLTYDPVTKSWTAPKPTADVVSTEQSVSKTTSDTGGQSTSVVRESQPQIGKSEALGDVKTSVQSEATEIKAPKTTVDESLQSKAASEADKVPKVEESKVEAPKAATDEGLQSKAPSEPEQVSKPDEALKSEAQQSKAEVQPADAAPETPETAELKKKISDLEAERAKVQKDLAELNKKKSELSNTIEKETKAGSDLDERIKRASGEERDSLRKAQTEGYRRRADAVKKLNQLDSGDTQSRELARIDRESNQAVRQLFKGSKPWRKLALDDPNPPIDQKARIGLYGELEMTTKLQTAGLKPLGKTVNPDEIVLAKDFEAAVTDYKGTQGIDGIYEPPDKAKYDFWETESKTTGTPKTSDPTGVGDLEAPAGNRQLSDRWSTGNLGKSGLTPAQQAAFETALKLGRVRRVYVTTDPKNGTRFFEVERVGDTEVRIGREITDEIKKP